METERFYFTLVYYGTRKRKRIVIVLDVINSNGLTIAFSIVRNAIFLNSKNIKNAVRVTGLATDATKKQVQIKIISVLSLF